MSPRNANASQLKHIERLCGVPRVRHWLGNRKRRNLRPHVCMQDVKRNDLQGALMVVFHSVLHLKQTILSALASYVLEEMIEFMDVIALKSGQSADHWNQRATISRQSGSLVSPGAYPPMSVAQ